MGRELYLAGDRDDVRRRLVDTICFYNGEPVYVNGSTGHTVELFDMTKKPLGRVDYRSEKFDYRSAKVGYLNFEKQAWYLNRIPTRSNATWGISPQNLMAGFQGNRYPTTWGKGMADCLKNKYPSFEECVRLITENGYVSWAFHRQFALAPNYISGELSILHRDAVIGVYNYNSKKVTLTASRGLKTLRILIKEAGVPYT